MAANSSSRPAGVATWDAPWVGGVLVGPGVASVINIPIPNTQGLVLSLKPPPKWRNSTSSVFIRNPADKRYGNPSLRLDYGPNKARANVVDYHWNIEGQTAKAAFPGITNHMSAGQSGKYLYQAAKAFRWGGRVFIVAGVVLDGVSILVSDQPLRRSFEVVTAWTAASLAAAQGGRAGAALGTAIEPGGGTIVGGFVGAVIGGCIGYYLGSSTAGTIYEWGEGAVFRRLPEVSVPSP